MIGIFWSLELGSHKHKKGFISDACRKWQVLLRQGYPMIQVFFYSNHLALQISNFKSHSNFYCFYLYSGELLT